MTGISLRCNSNELESLSLAAAAGVRCDIKPALTAGALLVTSFQAKFTRALSLAVTTKGASVVKCHAAAVGALCHKLCVGKSDVQAASCLSTAGCNCCGAFRGLMSDIALKHKAKACREENGNLNSGDCRSSSNGKFE